jgi:hypothetical protein
VGNYTGQGAYEEPFSEVWNGTSWTIEIPPNPGTIGLSALSDVQIIWA